MFRFLFLLLLLINAAFNLEAIDLCVHNTNARNLVEVLSRQYALNIMGTEKLAGEIDVNVENKDVAEVIRKIVEEKGYYLVEEKDIYYIEKNDELAKTSIKIFEPKFVPANELKTALELIYKGDQIHISPENNQIIVCGNKVQSYQAEQILEEIDRPVKQVNVEVYVVAVNNSNEHETGVKWEWENEKMSDNLTFKRALKNPFKIKGESSLKLSDNKSQATIIAKPNIIARNGAQAKILIGDRIPVIVEHENAKETKSSVEYEEAGISLLYTPYITAQGTIDTTLKAAISTPHLVPEMKAYRITTREAQTRVNLQDGEMLIIGGLMDRRKEVLEHKVPILGDIPILGKLFSHKLENKENTELFIVLKGTIEK